MKQFSINNTFALGGWVTPTGDLLNEKTFKDIAESGINLLFCSIVPRNDFEGVKKFAWYSEKYGLKVVLDVTEVAEDDFDEKDFLVRLDFYKKTSCIIGLSLGDEPGLKSIPKIEKAAKYLRKIKGDLFLYLNNLPIYATKEQLNGGWWTPEAKELENKEYDEFIDEMTARSGVDVLSYDHYPFRGNPGESDPRYFVQLSLTSEIAEKYNLPLFNFTQVTSWKKGEVRNTTVAEISCLCGTSVCYGVTGLVYFCCCTPASGVEQFEKAMIDEYGNKTESFYSVKAVNERLKTVFDCIFGAERKGIIVAESCFAEVPEKDRIQSFGDLKKIEGDGFIVGCFEKKHSEIYLIVNVSVCSDNVIKLKFDNNSEKKIYLAESENISEEELVVAVEAGGFVVVVDNRESYEKNRVAD